MAGDTVYTSSRRDTTVAGAYLEGDRVWMDVAHDLTVASLQDTNKSKSSNWSAGADVTVGYGVNVSANAGFGQGSSSSKWVGEQTAILGHKEVDNYTEANTHVKGAVIATDKGGALTLNTGSLTYEEIHDKDKGSNWGVNFSGGVSIGSGGFNKDTEIAGAKPFDYASGKEGTGTFTPDSGSLEYASYDKQGVLRPTITEGDIIIRGNPDQDLSGLNRDTEKSREMTKDEDKYPNGYISGLTINEVKGSFDGIQR